MNTIIHQGNSCSQTGAANRVTLIVVAGVILLLIIAGIMLYPRPAPEPEITPTQPAVPPATKEERGDAARDIITDLESGEEPGEYEQAYTEAREFQAQGRHADAQLLYFFAARGGYAPAAFDLATFYDPNHFSPESGLMDKPDPFQAYKWYKQALELGQDGAETRLAELHAWAESAAATGDTDAENLLLVWE